MKQYYLGIEFGSTRVKAVLIDGEHRIVKSGDYKWKSSLEYACSRRCTFGYTLAIGEYVSCCYG